MFDDVPGEVIALLTTLCWSIGIFPFTEASKRIGAAAVNTYRLLFAFVIVTLCLILFQQLALHQIFANPTSRNYLYLCLSGLVGFAAGDFLGFSSFVRLGPKLASLYTTLAPGFALMFGFFLLGERINYVGIIGIAVTVSGVILLTQSRAERFESAKPDKLGIIFGITSAFCQGLGLALSKMGMEEHDGYQITAMHANWLRIGGGFFSSFIFSIVSGNLFRYAQPVFSNKNNGVIYMVIGTFFGPVAGVSLSLLAVSKLDVAVAQTFFALLPVLVLPLNSIFYKGKITVTAIACCVLSICGVMILVWRDAIIRHL